MPRRRRNGRRSKFVTKRGLPFQLMKYAETKYNDHTIFDQNLLTAVVGTNQLQSLVTIGGGTSVNSRIGHQIQVSGFYGRLIIDAALTGASQFVRVCVCSPRVTDNATAPIGNMVGPIDPDDWIIWYDKTHMCPFTPGGGKGVITFKKKFKPYMKTLYDTSFSTTVTQGNLVFCILPKTDMGVNASWSIRTYFKDV